MKLSHTEDTPDHLLIYIFENLPQEFTVGICHKNLPRLFTARICHRTLPWLFAVSICKQILFCICEQILFVLKKTIFICVQSFSYLFSLLTVFIVVIAVAVMGHRSS